MIVLIFSESGPEYEVFKGLFLVFSKRCTAMFLESFVWLICVRLGRRLCVGEMDQYDYMVPNTIILEYSLKDNLVPGACKNLINLETLQKKSSYEFLSEKSILNSCLR